MIGTLCDTLPLIGDLLDLHFVLQVILEFCFDPNLFADILFLFALYTQIGQGKMYLLPDCNLDLRERELEGGKESRPVGNRGSDNCIIQEYL